MEVPVSLTLFFFLKFFVRFYVFFHIIVFIRSSPDIRWKCYKNTANSRTKKEKYEIYENRMLSVIKVGIKPTK